MILYVLNQVTPPNRVVQVATTSYVCRMRAIATNAYFIKVLRLIGLRCFTARGRFSGAPGSAGNPTMTFTIKLPSPLPTQPRTLAPPPGPFRSSCDARNLSEHPNPIDRYPRCLSSACFLGIGLGKPGGVHAGADQSCNRVRTLTGKEIELDIEMDYKVRYAPARARNATNALATDSRQQVAQIKEKVEEKEGIPPVQQRLIHGGKQMYATPWNPQLNHRQFT